MQVPDTIIFSAFTALGTVIATLAGAVTWVTKNHLAQLTKRVEEQELHIDECDHDRKELREVQESYKERIESLEGVVELASNCPLTDCPKKDILKLTQSQKIKPAKPLKPF